MSKTKKLSHDEKRNRLLELFYEKKEPFLLKELEKIAPKEKGITFQTVKEVLTSLVDDDLVDTDKIGTSTYFWAFPSKGFNKKLQKVNELEKRLNNLKTKEDTLENEIQELIQNSKEENSDDVKLRVQIQEEIIQLEKDREKLQQQIDRYKDCDPNNLDNLKKECQISRTAIDRWTDNVFAIKSWCKNKFYMEDAEINKSLGIPSNFDYYES